MYPTTKIVNIKADVPIRDFKPPIHGTCNRITMTTGQILRCLCKRAVIDEVLPDGTTVRLNMSNYHLDNTRLMNNNAVPAIHTEEVEKQVVETKPVDMTVINDTAGVSDNVESADLNEEVGVDDSESIDTDDAEDTVVPPAVERPKYNNYNKKNKKH